MTTDKQIAANRANAQLSTGPTTEAGKTASSKNALKHGALSNVKVAKHDESALFDNILTNLNDEHNPQTTVEHQLVERMAVLFVREIRLARAEAFEASANRLRVVSELESEKRRRHLPVVDKLPRHYRALESILPIETQLLIGRYQTMLSNQITQTLKQLRDEQKLGRQTIEAVPTDD